MKTDQELNEEWIITHYGPISMNPTTLFVATVPVWGGVAIGIGMTKADALQHLRYDLSHATRNVPARDAETTTAR